MGRMSEAKKQYMYAYLKEHKERIVVDVPKGEKARYKALAERENKSLAGLIMDLLDQEEARRNWLDKKINSKGSDGYTSTAN